MYDFTPQEEGELAFKRGDVITVTNRSDVNWWRGEIGSREGLFPAAYVSPYHAPWSTGVLSYMEYYREH